MPTVDLDERRRAAGTQDASDMLGIARETPVPTWAGHAGRVERRPDCRRSMTCDPSCPAAWAVRGRRRHPATDLPGSAACRGRGESIAGPRPAHAGLHTLVIVSSFSGDTAEALSAAREAVRRGCRVIAITSGGAARLEPGAEHEIAAARYPRFSPGPPLGI